MQPTLKYETVEPSYIVMINDKINLGTGRHLFMERNDRIKTIDAASRICKRIRGGTIQKVIVRKVKDVNM